MNQPIIRCPNCNKLSVINFPLDGQTFFCGYCKRLVEGKEE